VFMKTETPNQIAKLSEHLATISTVVDAPALSQAVVALLRDFVNIDEIAIISYPPRELPMIDYRDTDTPTTKQNLDTFIQGAFVLGISIETVKLHRRNAYAKLEVKSHVEFFMLLELRLGRLEWQLPRVAKTRNSSNPIRYCLWILLTHQFWPNLAHLKMVWDPTKPNIVQIG